MRTRILIGLSALLFGGVAWLENNTAALYVAAGVHAILYMLHTIEVKLNKLLDKHGIWVTDADVARD